MIVMECNGQKTVTYEGAVLTTRERNYRDDSDFYAVVWDEAAQDLKTVEYATTRGWTYNNGATVDATPEVRKKAADALFPWALDLFFDREVAKLAKIEPGVRVRNKTARKAPKGAEGVVFWKGPNKFRPYYRGVNPEMRIGVRLDDGTKFFTAPGCVEPIYDVFDIDLDAVRKRAREYADTGAGGLWQLPYEFGGMAVLA